MIVILIMMFTLIDKPGQASHASRSTFLMVINQDFCWSKLARVVDQLDGQHWIVKNISNAAHSASTSWSYWLTGQASYAGRFTILNFYLSRFLLVQDGQGG